jgi:hypothetical protein
LNGPLSVQVFPGRPAITPKIAMKPATLCFVFDPDFVRSAYVRLCVDSERSVSFGLYRKTIPHLAYVAYEHAIAPEGNRVVPVRQFGPTLEKALATADAVIGVAILCKPM